MENFTEKQKEQIIKMYNDKTYIGDIIDFYQTDEHHIRQVLKEAKADRHYNIWSEELYDRAIKLYGNGQTLNKISYDLLVTPQGLSKGLKKKEIEMRTYSDSNRKYKRNSEYFDNINTPNKAYVLGLIYADGNNYIYRKKHCLTISLQEDDYELLERVRQELEYEGSLRLSPLHDKNPNYKNHYILSIVDIHLCEQLKKIGVVERKSLVLEFPTFLRPDLIRHFVRGYFDGDGSNFYDYTNNKMIACVTGTREFILSLSKILESIYVNHSIAHPKQSKDSNTYVLKTNANLSSFKFLSWIYQDCDIKMQRKYQRYLDFCEIYQNNRSRIKSL